MKPEFTALELIEKYLKGKLNSTELKELNFLLKDSKSLSAAAREHGIIIEGIKEAGRNNLKKKLKGLTAAFNREKKRADAKFTITKKVRETLTKLYSRYFSPYEDLVTVRSGNKKYALLNEAMHYYNNHNYDDAVKLFRKILRSEPQNIAVLFYSGIALLEMDKAGDALKAFKKVIRLDSGYLKEQSLWYTGLIYLKQYDVNKAIRVFSAIPPDYANYSFAQKIMKTLEKLS
jgi:tetratricopeptide (TPR) repeat protein